MSTLVEDRVAITAELIRLEDGTARLIVRHAQSYAGALPVRMIGDLDVTQQAPAAVKTAAGTVLDWLTTKAKEQFNIP
jgi:hypothetical protein